jgi:hypothetical protein
MRTYLRSSPQLLHTAAYTRDLAGAGVIGACSRASPGNGTSMPRVRTASALEANSPPVQRARPHLAAQVILVETLWRHRGLVRWRPAVAVGRLMTGGGRAAPCGPMQGTVSGGRLIVGRTEVIAWLARSSPRRCCCCSSALAVAASRSRHAPRRPHGGLVVAELGACDQRVPSPPSVSPARCQRARR